MFSTTLGATLFVTIISKIISNAFLILVEPPQGASLVLALAHHAQRLVHHAPLPAGCAAAVRAHRGALVGRAVHTDLDQALTEIEIGNQSMWVPDPTLGIHQTHRLLIRIQNVGLSLIEQQDSSVLNSLRCKIVDIELGQATKCWLEKSLEI